MSIFLRFGLFGGADATAWKLFRIILLKLWEAWKVSNVLIQLFAKSTMMEIPSLGLVVGIGGKKAHNPEHMLELQKTLVLVIVVFFRVFRLVAIISELSCFPPSIHALYLWSNTAFSRSIRYFPLSTGNVPVEESILCTYVTDKQSCQTNANSSTESDFNR